MTVCTSHAVADVRSSTVSKVVVAEARRHGVPSHRLRAWVKRKVGGIQIERARKDGTFGCSVPCVMCRRLILGFDLKVTCRTETGEVFHGKLSQEDAPPSKLTSGQKYIANSRRKGARQLHDNHFCEEM